MSELGEAAQASARPCLRFFLTLRARPFILESGLLGNSACIMAFNVGEFVAVFKEVYGESQLEHVHSVGAT